MRAAAPFAALAALLVVSPGYAFDATNVDIVGLHLGMPGSEVVTSLQRQGFAVRQEHGALFARTRDGQLTVDLTDDHVIRRIRYALRGSGANETARLKEAVLDHFGPPDQATPLAWCRTSGHNGKCSEAESSLTYSSDTLTLELLAGTPSTE